MEWSRVTFQQSMDTHRTGSEVGRGWWKGDRVCRSSRTLPARCGWTEKTKIYWKCSGRGKTRRPPQKCLEWKQRERRQRNREEEVVVVVVEFGWREVERPHVHGPLRGQVTTRLWHGDGAGGAWGFASCPRPVFGLWHSNNGVPPTLGEWQD